MMSSQQNGDNRYLHTRLARIERRLQRLEEQMGLSSAQGGEAMEEPSALPPDDARDQDALEYKIGSYWLAKIGIVVLAFGIVFLLTLPYEGLPSYLPSLSGYVITGIILALSHYWRHSFSFMSRYLLGCALVLIYFATLRLHFLSENPVIGNMGVAVTLLLLVVFINLYISQKRQSVYLTSVSLILGYCTVILANNAYATFMLITLFTLVTVYMSHRFQWRHLLFLGIFLSYFTHLNWYLNNPFHTSQLQLLSEPAFNVFFLLLYAFIFSLANYFRKKGIAEDELLIETTILNGLCAFTLFFFITLLTFRGSLFINHLIAALFFLTLATAFWIREKSKYSTFVYATIGFMALSVSIISHFPYPAFFIYLCWQSLLVVVAAIWFRSKIIIVANLAIYLIIFLAYILSVREVSAVSISFGIVALLSARIMNWQKHRLEIKTEFMRNTYLASAFIVFPYALYHSVPTGYVGLSWVAVAIFYYALSLILHNKKYRWMALFTLMLTVLFVFIIGIARLEPVYRMASFIVLGTVLLAISLFYTKRNTKPSTHVSEGEKKK